MSTKTDIIRAMKKAGPLASPPDFTIRVMEQISGNSQPSAVTEALFRHRRLNTFTEAAAGNRAANSFVFFLAAFGHLVLAGILLVGFGTFTLSDALPYRVAVQPWIIFGYAVFFAAAGVVSHYHHPFLYRLLKFVLLIFLGFSTANGIMVQLALNAFFPASGIVLYSVVGLAVGTFLYSRIELIARCPQ